MSVRMRVCVSTFDCVTVHVSYDSITLLTLMILWISPNKKFDLRSDISI